MITFSQFQSLGEEEKLKLLIDYMNTYQPDEIAAHWHKTVQQVFDVHLDLILRGEKQGLKDKESNMLSYEEIKDLPPKNRAELILAYHQLVDGKTGILAERIGIEVKKAYNLIYQSKQKLGELNKKREDVNMTINKNHERQEDGQLYLSTNMIEDETTVELNGEGSGEKIARLLKSVAIMLEGTTDILTVELKIKRPD